MSAIFKIYGHAPVWLQNLMCSVKGWTIVRRRYGKEFFRLLSEYENHSVDAGEELQRFFEEIRYVPAYKQVFANAKDGRVKLSDFPIISKADVKAHYHDYLNTAYTGPTIMEHTSDTTGGGLVFPCSVEGEQRQWAVWWRYRESLGIKYGIWCGWFGGRQVVPLSCKDAPYWRINSPGRQVMYSAHHLCADTVRYYHDDIGKRKLTWLHGYPSSVSLLSSLIVESGLTPIESVKWVTTGAENLLEHHIETIRKAFPNALVRTHYGLAEGVANFSQDGKGEWQIDDDFAHAEFVPVDRNAPMVCRIIGTGFSNAAFPLVRYDTGDLAKVNWVDGMPKIVEIYGRQEDYIELPNGVKLGRLDHIFKDCIRIKEAQIHQIRKNLIELRVVRDRNYTDKDELFLLKEASSRFGNDVEVKITYCDRIERTKAGKVRFVVSELSVNKNTPPMQLIMISIVHADQPVAERMAA